MNELQASILDVAIRLDEICKKYEIRYYIMGGTALGAVRHGGFIPWDDDIDVFMTPSEFDKFRTALEMENESEYFIETVGLSDRFVEYAKFKKKGTTFIEKATLDKDIHHNVFVDIMLLRKCPTGKFKRKKLYYLSQLVSFLTISETGWQPKTAFHKFAKKISKILPRKKIYESCLKSIYKNETLEEFDKYCYFMSRVKMNQGIFDKELFSDGEYVDFENVKLYAPTGIKEYLAIRYGDYVALPPEDKRVGEHAFFVDTEKDYTEYIGDFSAKYAILSFRRGLNPEDKHYIEDEGHKYEVSKAYASGGEITDIEDITYPLTAVLIQGNSDMGILFKMLGKIKCGQVCVFDISGTIASRTIKKLIKILKKYDVTTVTLEELKIKLHGKV